MYKIYFFHIYLNTLQKAQKNKKMHFFVYYFYISFVFLPPFFHLTKWEVEFCMRGGESNIYWFL